MVVAAGRIDSEYLRPDLHQKHFVISDMAKQLALGEIGGQHALRQIWSDWPFFFSRRNPRCFTLERTTFNWTTSGKRVPARRKQIMTSALPPAVARKP